MSLIENSPLFTPWTDPVSGVTSYLLSRRAAPIQQSFYFTTPSFTHDGRYLWLYCGFPPTGDAFYGRQLAVVDLAEQTIRHFPETAFADASPYIDLDTGEAYWTTGFELWKRGPQPGDSAQRLGALPDEVARGRRPLRLATHLTRSADRKSFLLDAQLGSEWVVGDLPLDGSPFRLWQTFDRCHDHAQFSPTDPDLILLAQDYWNDAATGEKHGIDDRLWLLRRGEKARPIFPDSPSSKRGHEWWDADGEHVWYVHYQVGTEKVNIRTGAHTLVAPTCHTHSHADLTGRYLVGDSWSTAETWDATFYNTVTGKHTHLAAHLPAPPWPRARYHIHPHPQFCLGDRYVCYTTNVLGPVDLALVPVATLLAQTS